MFLSNYTTGMFVIIKGICQFYERINCRPIGASILFNVCAFLEFVISVANLVKQISKQLQQKTSGNKRQKAYC
mgnify:CR=1 FL=1